MVETKSVGVHYKTSFNQILRLPKKTSTTSPAVLFFYLSCDFFLSILRESSRS